MHFGCQFHYLCTIIIVYSHNQLWRGRIDSAKLKIKQLKQKKEKKGKVNSLGWCVIVTDTACAGVSC